MWIECKKIWYNKKLLGSILLLFLLTMGSFLYTAHQKQIQWETWNESTYEEAYVQKEQEYLSNFHASIEAVVQQADAMGTISIFAQTDTFSTKNLEQTKADFIGLLEIKPRLVESPFLEEYFLDKGIHIFVMLAGMLLAFALLEEQKQGLRGMVYAAVNGRGMYVLYKIAALLVWTGIVTVLFYGGLWIVSSLVFQGNVWSCLDMPLQSLSLFGNVPWKLHIGSFLIFYLLGRWSVVFFCSFLVWTILFCMDQMLIGVGMLGGGSLVLLGVYLWIDGTHAWNILHYCNPWYWILGNDFFSEYRNLDLFSQPVNKNMVILGWMCLFLLFGIFLSVWVGMRRYPCEASKNKVIQYGRQILQSGKKWKSSWMMGRSLTWMEYYKILISQKGILLFAAMLVVFVSQSDFTNIQFSTSQQMYLSFVERHSGVPNEASKKELLELEGVLCEVEETYVRDAARYEAGEITADAWIGTSMWYQSYEQERIFLQQMQLQTAYLEKLKEEKGMEGWYVNLYAYHHLLGEDNVFMRVLLCFAVILFCYGTFTIEQKSGMIPLIHGSVTGGKILFAKKRKVVWGVSILLYLIYSCLEISRVAYVYGLDAWEAPVQSILKLEQVPVSCNIGVFFLLWYCVRAFGILLLASVSGWLISRKGRRKL